MPDRLESLEAEVTALRTAVAALAARVEALESAGVSRAATTAQEAPPARGDAPPAEESYAAFVQVMAPLAGRMLLLLAGAFVLRALTDSGSLPAAIGVGLGFAYAVGILALAVRAGGVRVAAVHGLTAVLILFPLLHEATARFRLLEAPASALVLATVSAAVLWVARRRRLLLLAWTSVGAAVLTAGTLMLATGRLLPSSLVLVALGVLTAWLGWVEPEGWRTLRWPAAAAADLAVFVVLGRAGAAGAIEGPGPALAVAAVLVTATLASFAARTLVVGRAVGAFEVAQTAGALAAGLGGAALLATRTGTGTAGLGWTTLALAALAYAVAFAFVERRPAAGANFPFHASVALAFSLTGLWLAVPEAARGPALAVLSLASALLSRLRPRRTLVVHAAVYAAFAAGASGLFGHAARALFASAPAWAPASVATPVVLACLVAATFVAAGGGGRTTVLERLPMLAMDLVAAIGVAGVAAGWIGRLMAGAGPVADPGLVGTWRSAVLAAVAILAAWLGRREAGHEVGWLAWPLAGLLGLKLVLEDFPRGRPATLILSLAFMGAALILVPRLRASAPGTAPSSPA